MHKPPVVVMVLFAGVLSAACGSTPATPTVAASQTAKASPTSTTTATPVVPGELISEWAESATATSNYGPVAGNSWNASQATGVPNVAKCGDDGKAWASERKDTVDALTLKYAQAVVPTAVHIVESDNPGWITSVIVKVGVTRSVYLTFSLGRWLSG